MILRRRKMSDMANHKSPIEPIGRTHFTAHLRSKSEAITVDPIRQDMAACITHRRISKHVAAGFL